MKKILVATGTSPNKLKKTVAAISDFAVKSGVEAEVTGVNIFEVKIDSVEADVIVTIGPANFKTDIPVIAGTAFMTGIGTEKCLKDIIDAVK